MNLSKVGANGSPKDLRSVAMEKVIAVGNKTYQFTLISIGTKGPVEVGTGCFAKVQKDRWGVYFIELVGSVPEALTSKEAQTRLSGKFTSFWRAIKALRDFCKDNHLPIKIEHVTADGESLAVNPEAI